MEQQNKFNSLIFKVLGGGVDLAQPHDKILRSMLRYWQHQYRFSQNKHSLRLGELQPQHRQLALLLLSDVYGFSNYELLQNFQISRSTLSRDLNAARFQLQRSRKLQENLRKLAVETLYYAKYYY